MQPSTIALFGQATKGELNTLYRCKNVEELFSYFGEPPSDSEGLFHAIQTLLYGRTILYYRVHEEGVSVQDYYLGLKLLQENLFSLDPIGALFLPRVGESQLLDEGFHLCRKSGSLLLIEAADFYDYITDAKPSLVV